MTDTRQPQGQTDFPTQLRRLAAEIGVGALLQECENNRQKLKQAHDALRRYADWLEHLDPPSPDARGEAREACSWCGDRLVMRAEPPALDGPTLERCASHLEYVGKQMAFIADKGKDAAMKEAATVRRKYYDDAAQVLREMLRPPHEGGQP